ncbi:amidase [Pseudemcibacter aquimaris]|uniref:amidase n=1 Tax=Pseudemcibacter aquimaris TaxID=2857064 RepID=UPI0020127A7D|nr:amidase [Pseudemcibacter aquimaris]MCC3860227.1 amidase [Pseudemcibacter aquimaris]WDU57552.1 amidase [Pseudemcibacter aquimaris]
MNKNLATLVLMAVLSSCSEIPVNNEQETSQAEISINDFVLDEITVAELNEAYKNGTYTAEQVVKLYLGRIEALNKKGPRLNAVISVNPDAVAIAGALDQERQETGPRGPMHGIPILLKDNIDTKDNMPTTAGSIALKDNYAKEDSPLAASLREAGAIIIGKANLSEWANFRSTNSSSGWSGMGGQTRNPYLLTANTCGSSSGSGAAAAANMAAVTVGTETDGSVVCPAAYNGIVGIKPTVGLVSRTGIIPIAATQDTAGPMTRTVADAAYLLTAMVSQNAEDPATLSQPDVKVAYEDHLKADGLSGKRIGVIRSPFRMHDDLPEIFNENIEAMKAHGAVIIDDLEFGSREGIGKNEGTVLDYEFKHYLNEYLKNTPDAVETRTLEELIAFNIEHADEEMPYFKQEIFLDSQEKGPLTDQEYLEAAQGNQPAMQKVIDDLMDAHNLDLIVLPSRNPANSQDVINGDHPSGGGTSSYAAVSGYPSITVPMGYIHELPVSLSFIGRAYSEAMMIEAAYAFENATKVRRKPKFLPYVYE